MNGNIGVSRTRHRNLDAVGEAERGVVVVGVGTNLTVVVALLERITLLCRGYVCCFQSGGVDIY